MSRGDEHHGKAHVMRQVGTGKANASEPLLKCRKRSDGNRNRGPVVCPGMCQGIPVYCPGGCPAQRCGASPVQALARNVGTPRRDGAGWRVDAGGGRENPKQLICEGESTDARQGDGPPRSSGEGPVTGWSEGGGSSGFVGGQPEFLGGAR